MVIAAVWIQFIYHDVAHTPQMAGHLGQRLKCCNVEFEDFHPECYPIKISQNDPFYKKFGLQCQEYARSGTASRVGCTLGPREQINQVTSFIGESFLFFFCFVFFVLIFLEKKKFVVSLLICDKF